MKISLLIINKFKISAVKAAKRSHVTWRNYITLTSIERYRIVFLVHHVHTVIELWHFSRGERSLLHLETFTDIQLGGTRARIRVSEKIRYADSCPLNEAYIMNVIHFKTPVESRFYLCRLRGFLLLPEFKYDYNRKVNGAKGCYIF